MRSRSSAAFLLAAILTASACHRAPKPVIAPRPSPVAQLQHDLDATLNAPALERGFWGVLVRSLRTDETLYAANARKLFLPASTLKAVTLAVAAERLGWDFTYETRLLADRPIAAGHLRGSLVVAGSGDPSIDARTVDGWADSLKQAGLVAIDGGVIADASAFAGPGLGFGFGWSWDDVPYSYSAPVAAAQYHENAVDMTIAAGAAAGDAVAWQIAPASDLVVESRLVTGASDASAEFTARRLPGSSRVIVDGIVPAGSKPRVEHLSVDDPAVFLASALRDALLARGVAVSGAPSASRVPSAPSAESHVLLATRSAPLEALARRMMEVSQNQYAETLLTTLGARAGTATAEGGEKVVQAVLASWGVPDDGAILRDGSGLSRYDFIAPESLVQVLTHMYRDPRHSTPYFETMNVAGVSGTLASRMKNTAAERNVRAKDGSMTGVRALCGIATTADDEPLVFAIMANNFAVPGPAIAAIIDKVMAELARFSRAR